MENENNKLPKGIVITGVNIGAFMATGYSDSRSFVIEFTEDQLKKIQNFQQMGYSLSQSSLNYDIKQ